MKQLRLKYKLKTLMNSAVACHYSSNPKFVNRALGGKSNFEKDFSETHIETSYFQKVLLGLGSGFMSITDPRRGDMVAVMGESTGALALEYVRSKMLESEEGRQILEEKPRISSASVDLEKLKEMPEGTLGKAYSNFLERYKYSPDERLNVRFVDDIELAYVATRYREAHDLFHTVLDMPTNMLGEVTVKWVEAIQTKLPMCVTGAFFGPLRLAPKFIRSYSTRATAILDTDVHNGIKSETINPKKSPWKVNSTNVQIPEHIEKNIISVLKINNALKFYEESKKLLTQLDKRTIPVEGPRKHYLMEKTKSKLLTQMAFQNEIPQENINQIISKKLKRYSASLDNSKLTVNFDKKTGLMYLMSRAPYEYASLVRIFEEIHKKDQAFKPKSLFDFGSGVGTVIWAAKTFWGDSIVEYMTVDPSVDMNDIAVSILKLTSQMKPVVENLIQKQFFPVGAGNFDVVVSAFTLFELGNLEERMQQLCSLWNITSKYLVLVENGTKDGFRIIREAREMILQQSETLHLQCHVVAPCPHDFTCPKTSIRGTGVCGFLSKFKKLSIKKGDNYDKFPYSYVILKKSQRDVTDKQWPRIVGEVLSPKSQRICDLCTKGGKLEKVVISKGKYDAETYKCAKALSWGDFFPGSISYVEKSRKINEDGSNCQEDEIHEKEPQNENAADTENKIS